MPGFPQRSNFVSQHTPSTANFRNERARKVAVRREAGVFTVEHDLHNNQHLNDPDRHVGNHASLSRLPEEALTLISQLDPMDPAYKAKYRGIVAHFEPVWEEPGATPLVIDFTNVMEPLTPSRLHPATTNSKHRDAPFYRLAKRQAFEHDSRRSVEGTNSRNEWYWQQMDKGLLPPDFNPYPPKSQRHTAFAEHIELRDDRPTAVSPATYSETVPVLMTPYQIRKRARRKAAKGIALDDDELEVLISKPLEEWDIQELAKGYPRLPNGKFPNRAPAPYVQMAMKEKIDREFKAKVRGSMNVTTVDALQTLAAVLSDDSTDHRGKPHVSASTKVDAAKFLVEHLLGKPKQTVENDISVKLQGILAGVMVSPEMTVPSPGNPALPVGPTGRYLAGQRGSRQDYDDEELGTLRNLGIIDAEVVEDDDQ